MKYFKGYRPGWLSRMLCKHEYDLFTQVMINAGMGKMMTFTCKCCGGKKVDFI